jgi:hypothetical protein
VELALQVACKCTCIQQVKTHVHALSECLCACSHVHAHALLHLYTHPCTCTCILTVLIISWATARSFGLRIFSMCMGGGGAMDTLNAGAGKGVPAGNVADTLSSAMRWLWQK